jgi:hypothetical protein
VSITSEVKGLTELLKKIERAYLLDGPQRTFLTKAAIVVQGKARERAPVDKGRLNTSIAIEIDTAIPPQWAKVGTNIKSPGGASYPRILDESERTHYRGGSAMGMPSLRAVAQGKVRAGAGSGARMGSKTKGWFSKVPDLVQASIRALRTEMAREIKARFER